MSLRRPKGAFKSLDDLEPYWAMPPLVQEPVIQPFFDPPVGKQLYVVEDRLYKCFIFETEEKFLSNAEYLHDSKSHPVFLRYKIVDPELLIVANRSTWIGALGLISDRRRSSAFLFGNYMLARGYALRISKDADRRQADAFNVP